MSHVPDLVPDSDTGTAKDIQKKLVKRYLYVRFYNNFDVLQIYKTKKCPKDKTTCIKLIT